MILSPYQRRFPRSAGVAAGGAVNTLSLAHFNGADGATTTTDEVAGISWALAGGAQLDTATKKFGTASVNPLGGLCFGGTFTSPHAGDWTFECWARTDDDLCAIQLEPDLGGTPSLLSYISSSSGIICSWTDGVANLPQFDGTAYDGMGVFSTTDWVNVAFVRHGTHYYIYFNGVRYADVTNATNLQNFQKIFLINGATAQFDEVRLSNIARYTGASYTVATSEFTVD